MLPSNPENVYFPSSVNENIRQSENGSCHFQGSLCATSWRQQTAACLRGPVSDAARHFTAHRSWMTVTKRADPPPDSRMGGSGVRRVTRDGWTNAPTGGCGSPHPSPAARPAGTLGLLPRAELGDRTVPQHLSSRLPHESGSSRPGAAPKPAHPNHWCQRSSLPRVNPPEQQRQQAREAGPGLEHGLADRKYTFPYASLPAGRDWWSEA